MCSACASASGRTAVTEMSSPRHSPPSRAVIWDRVQVVESWFSCLVCRLKGLAGVHFFNDAVGNVVLGVDVNHVLQNDIVTFLFGDFDDDAVGVLLEEANSSLRRRL